MSIRIFYLVGFYLLTTLSVLRAGEPSVENYADRFYKEWSAQTEINDAGSPFDTADFYREVPQSLQFEVLNRILRRASFPEKSIGDSMATYSALQCIADFVHLTPSIGLSGQLDADLASLSKSANYGVRVAVLNIFRDLKRAKDYDVVVAALDDSKDEVRGAAIDALRGRPHAKVMFKEYIRDHQSDRAYATSVLYAKSGLGAAN